jgi:delta8-fatty-acid desaturase
MRELENKTSEVTLAYRELRQRLWEGGYFQADATYFYWKHVVWVSLILGSVLLAVCGAEPIISLVGQALSFLYPSATSHDMLLSENLSENLSKSLSSSSQRDERGDAWWISILSGCFLGLGWQQAAFVAHDALHNGIQVPKKGGGMNWLGWFLGSPIFGISSSLWTEEHNAHHAVTLRPLEDPQFNYLPLWMISEKELEVDLPSLQYSSTGEVRKEKYQMNVVVKFLVSIQHWTFLPLCMLIGRFNFYLISFVFALKQLVVGPTSLHRWRSILDIAGMCMYWCWFVSLTCMFSTTSQRWMFVLASHWTVGILHVQLLLSHLATETFTAEEEDEIGFFSFQLGTSRNIEVWEYEHWFHGGLEYQIEHHLFPQLPRHQLEAVKPMVFKICQDHDVEYRSVSFTQAMGECLSNFKRLAAGIVTLEMG